MVFRQTTKVEDVAYSGAACAALIYILTDKGLYNSLLMGAMSGLSVLIPLYLPNDKWVHTNFDSSARVQQLALMAAVPAAYDGFVLQAGLREMGMVAAAGAAGLVFLTKIGQGDPINWF